MLRISGKDKEKRCNSSEDKLIVGSETEVL
jgi:hypothetical protein